MQAGSTITEPAPSRSRSLLRRAVPALFGLVGLAFALRSLILAIRLSTPVPYSDAWAFVDDMMRYRDADYGFSDLFAQHNEHRIFTARLGFFLDYRLFHLGNLSVVLTGYAVLALLAALLAALAGRGRGRRVKLLAFTCALPALWSVAGWINLGWAFQLQWDYVHLMPALAVACFAAAAGRGGVRSWALLALAGLCDALGVYSMSSGLVTVAPIVAVAFWMRARPALLAAFVAFHALLAALFLWGYSAPPQDLVHDPVRILHYLAPYLGTAFPASKHTSIVVGGIGLAVALAVMAAATWDSTVRRRRLDAASAALLGVAAFALAEGLATAFGRAGLPNPTGLALRYGTPSEVFWAALALFGWRALSRLRSPWPGRGFAGLAMLAVAASNLVGATSLAWTDWSEMIDADGFNMINGVVTDSAGQGISPMPEQMRDRLAFVRERQLGPFAEGETRFRAPLNSLGGAAPASLPACAGALDVFDLRDGGLVHLKGWAVTPGVPVAAPWMLAIGSHGEVLGYTRAWQRRIDARKVSGRSVVLGYDTWLMRPEVTSRRDVALVAVFPGGTAPPCRVPMMAEMPYASQPVAAP